MWGATKENSGLMWPTEHWIASFLFWSIHFTEQQQSITGQARIKDTFWLLVGQQWLIKNKRYSQSLLQVVSHVLVLHELDVHHTSSRPKPTKMRFRAELQSRQAATVFKSNARIVSNHLITYSLAWTFAAWWQHPTQAIWIWMAMNQNGLVTMTTNTDKNTHNCIDAQMFEVSRKWFHLCSLCVCWSSNRYQPNYFYRMVLSDLTNSDSRSHWHATQFVPFAANAHSRTHQISRVNQLTRI